MNYPFLRVMEELEQKFQSLSAKNKNKPENTIYSIRRDKIINNYLPKMVDNYCGFSFKYRNENFVKKENTKNGEFQYTAKELLLKNLAKVIEQIYILEEDFNQNNKRDLLVQEKILNNFSFSYSMDAAPVFLKNKFKYEENNNFFKKKEKLEEKHKAEDVKNELESETAYSSFMVFLIAPSVIVISVLFSLVQVYKWGISIVDRNPQTDIASLKNITVNTDYGRYIYYFQVPAKDCQNLVKTKNKDYSKVMIDAYTLKDTDMNLDENKLVRVCNLSSTRNAYITFEKS